MESKIKNYQIINKKIVEFDQNYEYSIKNPFYRIYQNINPLFKTIIPPKTNIQICFFTERFFPKIQKSRSRPLIKPPIQPYAKFS